MRKLMIIFILAGVAAFSLPLNAEEFVCLECSYTCYTHLHGSSELPIVTHYRQRGILKSRSQNKFLDRATYFMEGMLTRPASDGQYLSFKKGEGKYAIVIIDSDGDMILGYEYGDITLHYLESGPKLSGEFTEGTGKYKGISGKFKLSKFTGDADDEKTVLKKYLDQMPALGAYGKDDHEMCNLMIGNFTVKNQ